MKKYVSLFLAALTVAAALTVSSAASSNNGVRSCDAEYVNASDADASVNLKAVEKIIGNANRIIEDMVEKELSKPNPDIEKLIARTNIIASNAMAAAENLGAEVECVYTAYEYDGVVFYIDPLIVIRRINAA